MTFAIYLTLCLFGISAHLLVPTGAIIGGFLVFARDEISYPISLQYPEKHHACGGGLIRNKFILTAARCVVDHNNEFIGGQLFVVRAELLSLPIDTVKAQRVYVPRAYNAKNRSYEADIAVVELNREFRYPRRSENNTHWLELSSDRNQDIVDGFAKITGYGWTWIRLSRRHSVVGNSNGRLKFANVDVFSDEACENVYAKGTVNAAKQLCAKVESLLHAIGPCGVCNGDIGGLLVDGAGVDAMVLGVLSKNTPMCDERQRPAIYTRVSHYHQFIERALVGKVTSDMRMHVVPQ